jgi:hypothetical protein
LSGGGTTRTLAISAITVADGETVSVAITSPSGFMLSGSPQTAVVHKAIVITIIDSFDAGAGSLLSKANQGCLLAEIAGMPGGKRECFCRNPVSTLANVNIVINNTAPGTMRFYTSNVGGSGGGPIQGANYGTLVGYNYDSTFATWSPGNTASAMSLPITPGAKLRFDLTGVVSTVAISARIRTTSGVNYISTISSPVVGG